MKTCAKLFLSIGLTCYSLSAFAAGFLSTEQSVSGMGTAYAGVAVAAEDASTVFTNPAGMISLDGEKETAMGRTFIIPFSRYKDHGSTRLKVPPPGQVPFPTSTNGGHPGVSASNPYMNYAQKLGPRLSFGISISSPFGQFTKYSKHWWGRYYATQSRIISLNISPAFAIKFNDCFSVGFGVNIMYLNAMFRNQVDFGLIGALAGIPGLTPECHDGKSKLKGCNWGFGANIGFLYKFNCDRTRFGFNWRSRVREDLNRARVKFKNVPVQLQPSFQDGTAHTVAYIPDVISFGFMHRITKCFNGYLGFQWTHWSLSKKLQVKLKRPPFQTFTPLGWKDVWRVAVGFSWELFNKKLCLKTGFAYDKSPTPNKELRTPRLPDEDRAIFTIGLRYQLTKEFDISLAYLHSHFKPAEVDKRDFAKNPVFASTGGLFGRWRTYSDLYGVQIHRKF